MMVCSAPQAHSMAPTHLSCVLLGSTTYAAYMCMLFLLLCSLIRAALARACGALGTLNHATSICSDSKLAAVPLEQYFELFWLSHQQFTALCGSPCALHQATAMMVLPQFWQFCSTLKVTTSFGSSCELE